MTRKQHPWPQRTSTRSSCALWSERGTVQSWHRHGKQCCQEAPHDGYSEERPGEALKQWENGGDAGISRLTNMEGIWTILCTILKYYWQFCEQFCVQFWFWYCSILLRMLCEILWTLAISNNCLHNFVQYQEIPWKILWSILFTILNNIKIFRAI